MDNDVSIVSLKYIFLNTFLSKYNKTQFTAPRLFESCKNREKKQKQKQESFLSFKCEFNMVEI